MFGRLILLGGTIATTVVVAGCGGDRSDSKTCSTLRIAGGSECPTPPKAIVLVRNDRGYCSGTFITTRHVLTAAHCIPNGNRGVTVQSDYFSYTATGARAHPQYNPGVVSDEHDVAVITIGQDAPVTPVPINASAPVVGGDSVVTYGFGLDESDETAFERIDSGDEALKATTLDIVSVSNFSVKSISDGTGDTCQGDSGGSLLLPGADGEPGVVAIVRSGPLPCQPEGGPSDNTNLQSSSVLNFVRSIARGVRLN